MKLSGGTIEIGLDMAIRMSISTKELKAAGIGIE
jgi:hypothetical protein